MSYSFFYCNNLTRFESVFWMKTLTSRLFKKYSKIKKSRVRFCLPLGWLHSVGAEAHKLGKVVFGPTLSLLLPLFGERKKGKLHILK